VTLLQIYILLHTLCSIICYGAVFGYWQGKYEIIRNEHYIFDILFSMFWALFGPLGLLSAYSFSKGTLFNYGFKFY
jgi:hypothetical protein